HTRSYGDWSSDVCSSDLLQVLRRGAAAAADQVDPLVLDEIPQRGGQRLGPQWEARLAVLQDRQPGVRHHRDELGGVTAKVAHMQIGRASCRERVWSAVGA